MENVAQCGRVYFLFKFPSSTLTVVIIERARIGHIKNMSMFTFAAYYKITIIHLYNIVHVNVQSDQRVL